MKVLNVFIAGCAVLPTVPAIAQSRALPHAIVYKTKQDYSKYLAVELTADKKKIASYPAPTDVKEELMPVKLKDGYWLSKMGVSRNTAYLAITCEDYRKLIRTAPTVEELTFLIKDRSPMTELWDCGVQGALTVPELNSLIEKKQLKTKCTLVK